MSADNYYVVMPHPRGGFTYVQGFASDGYCEDDDGNEVEAPPLVAEDHHPQFPTVAKALAAALAEYSEYGVSVDAACGDWSDDGEAYHFHSGVPCDDTEQDQPAPTPGQHDPLCPMHGHDPAAFYCCATCNPYAGLSCQCDLIRRVAERTKADVDLLIPAGPTP